VLDPYRVGILGAPVSPAAKAASAPPQIIFPLLCWITQRLVGLLYFNELMLVLLPHLYAEHVDRAGVFVNVCVYVYLCVSVCILYVLYMYMCVCACVYE